MAGSDTINTLLYSVFGGGIATAVTNVVRTRAQNRRDEASGRRDDTESRVQEGSFRENQIASRDDRIDELLERVDALEHRIDDERSLRRGAEDEVHKERAARRTAQAAADHLESEMSRLHTELSRALSRIEALEAERPGWQPM